MGWLHNTQLYHDIMTWASRKVTGVVKNLWSLVTRAGTQILTGHLHICFSLKVRRPDSSDVYFLLRRHWLVKKRASKDWYVWFVGVITTVALSTTISNPLHSGCFESFGRKLVCGGTVRTLRAWPYIWKHSLFSLYTEKCFSLTWHSHTNTITGWVHGPAYKNIFLIQSR